MKPRHFSILDLFRYKSLSKLTIGCSFIHIVVSLQFYGPALILDRFQLNIFVNGLVIALSELAAYPICFAVIKDTKRKTIAQASYAVIAVASFCLIFVWRQGEVEVDSSLSQNILLFVLLLVFRLGVSVQYGV